MRDIPGTCWKTHSESESAAHGAIALPSFEMVRDDKRVFAEAFRTFYMEQNFANGRALFQDNGPWIVVHNPPSRPLSGEALDRIYALPYSRAPHPSYGDEKIPALSEVLFSITSHRGCFGECAFCAITSHQGRVIQPRSAEGIVEEAKKLVSMPEFKGYIHDVGGPTANFRTPSCKKSLTDGPCRGKSCLFPKPCPSLRATHRECLELLRTLRVLPGIKKVFVRSGLRYDYIQADPNGAEFLDELCRYHVSGQLKIAPEHASGRVLSCMRKAPRESAEKFIRAYRETNERLGMEQFLVPYFMSSHPGCGLAEALELALFIRDSGLRPEQVQEFAPTPGTPAACMYHTGIDPFTGESVFVERDAEGRRMQRALLQYWMPQNRELVLLALRRLGRMDLVGKSKKCLISLKHD